MASKPLPKPARPRAPAPAPAKFVLNQKLNQQTRKVLGKHYRAKFGVK